MQPLGETQQSAEKKLAEVMNLSIHIKSRHIVYTSSHDMSTIKMKTSLLNENIFTNQLIIYRALPLRKIQCPKRHVRAQIQTTKLDCIYSQSS